MIINAEFMQALIQPPKDSHPCIMWFWNGRITESEIRRQIKEYRDANIFEFFIHPMFGFEHRYLSEDFFRLIGIAVACAKENGMKFWIYDEYNWPSGSAGNLMMRKHPWAKASYLCHAKFSVTPGETVEAEVKGDVLDGYFMPEGGKTVHLHDLKKEKTHFTWRNNRGKAGTLTVVYRVYHKSGTAAAHGSKYSTNHKGYVDLMNPKVVDLFLKYTHEAYKAHFGDEFGKTIKGAFTDEPTYLFPGSSDNGRIAYTGAFYDTFRKLKGYNARPKAWMMFTDSDDVSCAVFKKDWHETLSYLFETNFAKRYHDWCAENNLIFTGHINWEEDVLYQTYHSGSFYNFLRHFDRPGMDTILSKQHIDTERFNIAAYIVASVAKYAGKKRITSETFTGSGWDFSANDRKRIANRLMIGGVNFLQYMAAYYSMRGARKMFPNSYPPPHNGINPQFVYYKDFNTYLARLQYLSGETVPDGKTLLLHPYTSCKCQTTAHFHHHDDQAADYYSPGDFLYKDATIAAIVNALQVMNRSFQFGFEEVLGDAEVRDGKLCLCGSEYEMIILPGVDYITDRTAKLLREFVAQNGKLVLANTAVVRNIDRNRTVVFRADPRAARNFALQRAGTEESKRESFLYRRKNIASFVTNDTRLASRANIVKVLEKLYDAYGIREDFHVRGEGVLCGLRKAENMACVFMVNDLYRPTKAQLCNDCYELAAVLDVQTLQVCATVPRGEAVPLNFESCGSKVMLGGSREAVMEAILGLQPEIPLLPAGRKLPLAPTVQMPYNLKTLAFRVSLKEKSEELAALAPQALEKRLREDPDAYLKPMGKKGTMYSNYPCPGDQQLYTTVEKGMPFVAYSEFYVEAGLQSVQLLSETLYGTKVILNGRLLSMKHRHFIHPDDRCTEVAHLLKPGKNTVILVGSCPNWGTYHSIPFTALKGDFLLGENEVLVADNNVLPCGDVTTMGYPNFAGIMTYRATVKGNRRTTLKVEAYDVVEVAVNGVKVADLVYTPRLCDLSGYLTEGENTIELTMRTKLNNIFSFPEPTGLISAGLY